MRLGDATRAEVLKVTTTRMWWILALVALVYLAFIGLAMGAAFGFGMDEAGFPIPEAGLAQMVYSLAVTFGYVFPLAAGALSVTGEFRHQTLTPTFLAVPHRGIALLAKGIVQFGLGAFYGLVAFVGTVGAGAMILSASGNGTGLAEAETWLLVLRGVLAMALWGVIGVGFGALIKNQVAAIVVILALTQFVEPMLRSIAMLNEATAKIANFLPGAASDALTGASFYQSFGMSEASISWWAGGLVLLAYAVGAALLGYWVTWRRDVT